MLKVLHYIQRLLHVQPEKSCHKLKVVLKQRNFYVENIKVVSLMAGLIMQGILKWKGLKSQRPLYCTCNALNVSIQGTYTCIIMIMLSEYLNVNLCWVSALEGCVASSQELHRQVFSVRSTGTHAIGRCSEASVDNHNGCLVKQ